MIYSVTGHRPKSLGVENPYSEKVRNAMFTTARNYLGSADPSPVFVLTGMALGWDQAVADACIFHGIGFIACIPFEGQELRWPVEAQRKYHSLLDSSAEVIDTSLFMKDSMYANGVQMLMYRNTYMVAHSDAVLALWNGVHGGGTFSTIKKAERAGLKIYNLYMQFLKNLHT